MQGFTTNYINLIADNLRDRYDNGFPILKELIQNADDAKARTFVFASHPGFAGAGHPLLQGPGLWFFNDGEFKHSDAQALRSFGINSKAGDTAAIGKFGLGMKSVFHLCEALFYVAWDGRSLHRQGLTPWKQEEHNPHPEWDQSHDKDWQRLEDLGRKLVAAPERSWFLLWIPLRKKVHLSNEQGEETGTIISCFPGDDPARELAFLDQTGLAPGLAEILPLLRHLERIEHRADGNSFALELQTTQRLLGQAGGSQTFGQVVAGPDHRLLQFAGLRRENHDPEGWFSRIKARDEWPRSWYRDERGQEHLVEDKTAPEGAVLFCTDPACEARSNLHWALFLPLEQGGERLAVQAADRSHTLILHGQFFIDAGRKKVHGLEDLHKPAQVIGEGRIDDSLLRRTWNQQLAQRVLLPLVLPALQHYVEAIRLPDKECERLTRALAESDWFGKFGSYVCGDGAWVRVLQLDAKPAWRLVEGVDRGRLRPLPAPPQSDRERPWQVFPRLADTGLLPFDGDAPRLLERKPQWQEAELHQILAEVAGLFTDGPRMDYLVDFLDEEHCARPYLGTEALQLQMIGLLRAGLRTAGPDNRRQQAEKSRRLLGFVEAKRRLVLTAELPEAVLRDLWRLDAPVLLIPKGIEPPEPGCAKPGDDTLRDWLQMLHRALSDNPSDTDRKDILDTTQGLLKTLDPERRGRFLRIHSTLRVIAVRDARTRRNRAASHTEIEAVRKAGTLFGFAQVLGDAALGLTPWLARALPDASVCLVHAGTYEELFPGEPVPPRADEGRACLAALGRDGSGGLGGIPERRALLEKANDPGSDAEALRGLRYLLHGSPAHRNQDGVTLWIPGHDQHPAWAKLWGQMYASDSWSLVPAELADTVPRNRWGLAGIQEIDARNLIADLQRTGRSIDRPSAFTRDEREEILSQIENADLWRCLPLHTRLDGKGKPVAADQGLVYLAPDAAVTDDPLFAAATLIDRGRDPRVAEQQSRWLRPLDHRARIELALAAPDPAVHWRAILDSLDRLGPERDPDLTQGLKATPWLSTRQGVPVKPMDVIDLPAGLADEARRLVGEHRNAHGPVYAVPSDLAEALVEHPDWATQARTLCASGENGLAQLGLLLADLPDYRIGPWSDAPQDETVSFLAGCSELPGWRLLAQAQAPETGFDPHTVWSELRDGFTKTPPPERLRATLDWLSAKTTNWKVRKGAFDQYLGWFKDCPAFSRGILTDLRLASADRQWQVSTRICAGAHGIDDSHLLDEDQARILGTAIRRADTGQAEADGMASRVTQADFDAALGSTAQVLADYFKSWGGGWVPEPMIGLVLGLLGYGTLAAGYLARPLDLLLSEIPWVDPGGDVMHRNWMHGFTRDQLMAEIQVAVQVLEGNRIDVPNLVGDWIGVPISQEVKSLLVGGIHWVGGYRALLQLRRVDPVDLGEEGLSRLLKVTAETLYAGLYNQPASDFHTLWQDLSRSDQLEIRVARRLILDHILLYLRQFPTDHQGLKAALARCDDWRHRIAEVEDKKRDAGRERQGQAQALEALARLIDQDQAVATAILAGVRAKLSQYQYDLNSIPFELFQNADDAAVELGQIEAHPNGGCEVPPGARWVVVEADEGGLRLLHWGRPINAHGPAGFDGEGRGFGRDLEKMLILSASDKQPGQGVTGKFGLGFKSVLLACDRPRILSGRLALEVVAGLLPEPWTESAAAREALDRHAPPRHRGRGTLIELPGIDPDRRVQILERFRRLAGILCVFGRAVRTIALCDGQAQSNLAWEPKAVAPRVEYGRLRLKDDAKDGWGTETDALCLRAQSGAVLLALGPGGFRLLPKDTPTLWVTAPLRETDGFGFACTAAFDLDAGRARLAGDSQHNLGVAQALGAASGEALGALFDRSHSDWPGLRRDLGLDPDLDPHDLWLNLWTCLAERWLTRPRDGAAVLARALALALLKRLSAGPKAVPNGLAEPFRALIDLAEARYQLDKALAAPEVIAILADWGRFAVRYPRQRLVSEAIGKILREGEMAKPANLGLTALVALIDPPAATPEDAEALGGVRLLTEDDRGWGDEGLKKRLRALRFRTAVDTWVEAARLVAGGGKGIEKDETLRHAFAPSGHRLDPGYWQGGDVAEARIALFLLARERLQVDTDDLAKWVLDADTPEMRRAALVYLSDGDLGQGVADRVKSRGWLPGALHDQDLVAGLDPQQVQRLQARLALAAQLQQIWQASPPQVAPPPTLDLATALRRIAAWWAREGAEEARQYYGDLCPSGTLDFGLDEAGLIRDRSAWLTLFAIGAFQGMGRTREVQHRGFIEYCRRRGWWQTFADLDPKAHPEAWMDVIEEYAEAQHDDEQWTQWIAQFPKLYRLRRWMDDYVELFRSIDRFAEPFTLDSLLAPRANPYLQGGGIEAPPLTRTLKVGGPLVIRELLYHGVIIKSALAVPHAYAPIQRIRDWFAGFGETVETSKDIHDLLCEHLGEDAATFGGAYDIPLRIVTADEALQQDLFS